MANTKVSLPINHNGRGLMIQFVFMNKSMGVLLFNNNENQINLNEWRLLLRVGVRGGVLVYHE